MLDVAARRKASVLTKPVATAATTPKTPLAEDRLVGARLRTRRMEFGMSQETLGNAIGLSFQQVQKYEKGTNRIGASRMVQIAKVLQVPASYFFADTDGAGEVDAADNPIAVLLSTKDGLALAKFFAVLTKPERGAIVQIAHLLAAARCMNCRAEIEVADA